MSNIVIPSTLVADTGTGATLTPYKMAGDTALYREEGATGVPALLQMKRTEPKPTKDYAGAAKGDVKFTRSFPDTLGRQWPAILNISSSVPDFLTDAQKSAFVDEAIRLSGLTVTRDALAKLVIPQS